MNGRDSDRLNDAARSVSGAIPIVGDVSNASGATALVESANEALGGIDILVTNAGGPPGGNWADTDTDLYPAALDLSLMSVVAMTKAAVPAMQAQSWGRVLAITSVSVRQPLDMLILSNTARAGVTGYLKTMANQVAADGVTVNSLQPATTPPTGSGSYSATAWPTWSRRPPPTRWATPPTSVGLPPSCVLSTLGSLPARPFR